jgi:hypothetical protein
LLAFAGARTEGIVIDTRLCMAGERRLAISGTGLAVFAGTSGGKRLNNMTWEMSVLLPGMDA